MENSTTSNKKVLVIGGGGREAALVLAYSKSPVVGEILSAPGNDSMHEVTTKPVTTFPKITTTDILGIIKICKEYSVDLVDISQDMAVASGLGDALEKEQIAYIGPKKEAGRLEWDKAWSRQFMLRHNIPHPHFSKFTSTADAIKYIDKHKEQPWVVKANGLAEGKGVILTNNNADAKKAVFQMTEFGEAGTTFLLEQYLIGEEFSMFIITDGSNYKILGSAQDHKRLLDGDTGLNTGGMGCSSPPLILDKDIKKIIEENIIKKTIQGMREEGNPYTGILYLGGMVVKDGKKNVPYVIEFNARWGDPEAQVVLPSIKTDLYLMGKSVFEKKINELDIQLDKKARVVIAGVSAGYPENYEAAMEKQIFGISEARKTTGVTIFGAGIKKSNAKDYVNGGRLFYVVGEGKTVVDARKNAYEAISLISIDGNNLRYRTDIGWRDVQRLRVTQG